MSENVVHIEPQTAATLAPYGTANIIVDAADDLLKASVNGAAFSRIATVADINPGTVTSVALAMPSDDFDVSGSPVTGAGTLTAAKKTKAANMVLSGPTSGADAVPTFRALVAADVPALHPGVILAYGGTSAPTGYLLCNGAAVSQTTYAALYAVIGLAYGNPGGGNFNLPDLRQKFPLGKAASGTGNALGDTGGSIDHLHAMRDHTHSLSAHTHDVNIAAFDSASASSDTVAVGGGTTAYPTSTSHTHSVNPPNTTSAGPSTANTGAPSDNTTNVENPPYLVVNFIIKT